jgi:hypothetical protein
MDGEEVVGEPLVAGGGASVVTGCSSHLFTFLTHGVYVHGVLSSPLNLKEAAMRKVILPAVAILGLFGAASYVLPRLADAQPAPAPAAVGDVPQDADVPQDPHGWMQHRHDRQAMHAHWRMEHAKTWSLFTRVDDKQLTVADVQKIAEAILLRHGNHSWKIINVVANQDNTVSFAFGAADGTVIARFAMDTKTGHLRRIGSS